MHRTAKLLIALFCFFIAIGWAADAPAHPTKVTGRFVASVGSPPLTSFGLNRELYVFQTGSAAQPQFVLLSYSFLLYEPQIATRALDYGRTYKLLATLDSGCRQTLQKASSEYVFDKEGAFMEIRSGITYSKNVPPLRLPWELPLSCYSLSADSLPSPE